MAEAQLSLQLEAEERIGYLMRRHALDARTSEDEAYDALKAVV